MVALPGAHSPQFYNPSPWLKKRAEAAVGAAALPPHPAPFTWSSEGGQLRQAEAAVDAGVVRARVGQAQGL